MSTHPVQNGSQWLQQLFHLATIEATVEAEPSPPFAEDSCWLAIDAKTLSPEQIELLTGKDGSVLDSIQYLLNTMLNLGAAPDQQQAYTVDLAGYRLRRHSELKDMADAAVEYVRKTGEEYELKSLSAAERRQVHTILKDYGDMETYSHGQEPDRRLVVRFQQPSE
jgi:spoIIIJ-associated protein